MAIVKLNLPHHRYEIHIESGLLHGLGNLLRHVAPPGRAMLAADANVMVEHGKTAARSIEDAGYGLVITSIEPGEHQKNLETVRRLYDLLLDARLERRDPIVALGGGVVGDTSGLVAATYLRGVPLVQCPTTLLSMVDSSVGGKVGVNVPQGKNLVGAFYQPSLVVIDVETLSTLPPRELRCGLAECVKHAIVWDADLFDWISDHLDRIVALDSDTVVALIERNVRIKASFVVADERETGRRAHLNFGHTFAHAIEATQGYDSPCRYQHGEAVALGMVAATQLAAQAGRCDHDVLDRLTALLDRIGLPIKTDQLPPTDRLLDMMRLDKKVQQAKIRLVLPDRVGAVSVIADTPADSIRQAWESLRM